MLFEVLYTFVLDGEVKRPHMLVDIDDYDTGMRLLEIGAVVKVPEAPARPDTSARKLDHDPPADVIPIAEMNAPETAEPSVTYHAVMFHTASRFDQHEREDAGLLRRAWARWRRFGFRFVGTLLPKTGSRR